MFRCHVQRLLPLIVFGGLSAAFAQVKSVPTGTGTLTVQGVQGRAEVQNEDGTWRPLAEATGTLERGLRTGTGRVFLTNRSGGRTLLGSASTLRVYRDETDFISGQFLLEGPLTAYVLGLHFYVEAGSRVRLDLSAEGSTRRMAVLQGSVRLSKGTQMMTVPGGQQINLPELQISTFQDDDPWYSSVFTGSGKATVEALRGNVQYRTQGRATPGQSAHPGLTLNPSDSLLTQGASWAEIGFTGGGYLRLTENSELKVLSIEKTAGGREVTLQLLRGSAWNVVQKGQGGYKISTPVVSTAVRGTKFRVDARGLVKVMEGAVALPSDPGVTLQQGEQKSSGSGIQNLQIDALDKFNEQRDAERNQPFELRLKADESLKQDLKLVFSGSPDVRLTATLPATNESLDVTSDPVNGRYVVQGRNLPDGQYRVQVDAWRFNDLKVWNRLVRVDHQPPTLTDLRVKRTGQVLEVTGVATDNLAGRMTLDVTSEAQAGAGKALNITRHVAGHFRLVLPAAHDLRLTLTDQAGNQVKATEQ